MLCKQCGSEMKEEWKICPCCGYPVPKEMEEIKPGSRKYKLKGMRRTGRFSFQEIVTDIMVEGENIHVNTQGKKKSESLFCKQEVQSINLPLLPIWRISDILRLAVFGILAFVTYGLSIFAILFSIKIMVSRHVRIKLTSGQTVKIPICQKADASEFLREFQYPLSEIEKNNADRTDDKKWAQREWLTSAALLAVAAGAITLGVTLKSENMNSIGTEDVPGENAETFSPTEDITSEGETEERELQEEPESMTIEEYIGGCEKVTGEELVRNPEAYIGKDVLLEGKFNILADSIVIDWFADSGIIRVDYDGKAIDVQGNVAGNVMSGDYGYVAGRYGGEDDQGTRYIDAEVIILANETEEDETNAAVQPEEFAIPAGIYVNGQLFQGYQALLTLTYFEDDEVGVEFSTEPQLNSIALYGFRIDDRTIQVAEEYTGIIVTLTWDSENEVTVTCSEEFTGMDSDLFNEMVNTHYALAAEN